MDNKDTAIVINYSTFEERNLRVGDFCLDFKVVKVPYPAQLNIKERGKTIYAYQYGSMDFAFEEDDLVNGIRSLHQSFIAPQCEKKYRTCNCGKIYRNPIYVIWCMANGHNTGTDLGKEQIWMDALPSAFYIPKSIIDLLLDRNDIPNLPANILNPLALPYSQVHKFPTKDAEKAHESQLFTRYKRLGLLGIIMKKSNWINDNQDMKDGTSIPRRSTLTKSLPLLLRMPYIQNYSEWPEIYKEESSNEKHD